MVKSARLVRKTKVARPHALAEPLSPPRELGRPDADRATVDCNVRAVARQKQRKQLTISDHVLDDGSGAVFEYVSCVGERQQFHFSARSREVRMLGGQRRLEGRQVLAGRTPS